MRTLVQKNGRYQGLLNDGRLLCVLPDVMEMNKGLFPEEELYNPQEWLSSADGENCWIEEKQDIFKQDDFRQQYVLAKSIGDRRFGSECKHEQVRNGRCTNCLRRVRQ